MILALDQQAIRTGAIPIPTACSICGSTPGPGSDNPVWLHDENYAEPLTAYHVCRRCHRALHSRFKHPERWQALVAQHARGGAWFELLTMDVAAMRQPFAVTYPNGLPRR